MSHRPHRSLVAVAILFAVTSVVTLATPRPTLAWSTGTFSSTSERALIAMTNRSRAAAGLRSLRVDSVLTSVARWRSKDMIDRDYFSHDIPGYGSVFKRLDSKGYCYRLAGENIGWNTYPDDEATAAIHGMFMDSPSHRANILGRTWEVIGVGAYKGPGGKKMWTVLFADKCGSVSKPKTAARPTPRPRPKPKPKPAPKATSAPAPTPAPTPTPTPEPLATSPLTGLLLPDETAPDTGPATVEAPPGAALQIVETRAPSGLVDTIVGDVTARFFGA